MNRFEVKDFYAVVNGNNFVNDDVVEDVQHH
jgi:hypothetical protein